ncbi:MAG: tetratricopeptide repeat protein [Rudaea sp.]|uniref:tetratricopeptide repeat protein n=1 Tax=unclassified Rudaea TaxID=2627037 RepID=UPI0010F9E329|nr:MULTISPECIES: tetratricopeptide repeat protein [unclassified Rudaea]MBN8888187.1 tetratricopeptide repeat protein [Rudaea sp.]MBR0345242.1 tetratricopeptide repeat protein [Rudaea sp.]
MSFCCRSYGVIAAALAAAMVCWSGQADAAPRVPANDSVVVERLPPAFLALRRSPQWNGGGETNVAEALAAARRYIEVGQTYSDPRAYGYAQSALGKWWDADPAPTEVLVMRARILQFRHQFAPALQQLEAALRVDQFDPDAWLLFASIAQVQGDVRAARSACLKLIPIADPLLGATCAASTAALSGHDDTAAPLIESALRGASAASGAEKVWAWTTLAEMNARLEKNEAATAAFREALKLSPDDVYARAAFADLLLDTGQGTAARQILGDAAQADALLLRAAIAAERTRSADADGLRADLAQRFAEARARGDETHLREQARFTLEVEHDPSRALELAARNFRVQREPADARILLEAAAAVGDRAAAQPALEWLARTGINAPRLQQLALGLSGGAAP